MLIDNCSSIWNLIYCWPSDVCCIQLCQMIHVECICILWVFMKVDAIIPIASELFEMSDKFLNIYLKCKPIIVLTMWSLVVSIIVQEDSSEPFLVIKKGEECEVKEQTLTVCCLVAFIMLNQLKLCFRITPWFLLLHLPWGTIQVS